MHDLTAEHITLLILCVFTCGAFAHTRNRSPIGWAVLGLIFGAVGLLVLLAVPPGRPFQDAPPCGS